MRDSGTLQPYNGYTSGTSAPTITYTVGPNSGTSVNWTYDFRSYTSVTILSGSFSTTSSTFSYSVTTNGRTPLGLAPNFSGTGYTNYVAPIPTYSYSYSNPNGSTSPSGGTASSVTLASPGTRSGYTFAGWQVQDINGNNLGTANVGDVYTLSRATVFVATWTINNITLTYNYNGNGSSDTTASVTPGTTFTLTSAPTRTGYTFSGWNDAYGTSYGTTGTSTQNAPSSPFTLYAQWTTIVNTVTYTNSYGSNGTTTQNVNYNSTGTFPNPGTRTGYVFGYWSNNSNYYVGASTPAITAATSYSADSSWTANTFTINYNASNGSVAGTGSTASTVGTYPTTSISVSSSSFTPPANYSFAGWSTTQGGALAYSAGNTYSYNINSASSNITLYARWTLNSVYVTYNANGSTQGSVPVDSTAYTPGTTVTPAANTGNLFKTGYTFLGWSTSPTAISPISNFTISTNTTLYAVWQNQVPAFTDQQISTTAHLNVAYSAFNGYDTQVTATYATSYSLGSGTPSWLTINSSGVLSGTPTAQGSYTFVINAISANSTTTASNSITLNVVIPGYRFTDSIGTKVPFTFAKRFIGIGQTTTNAQGATISADADGYVPITLMKRLDSTGTNWVDIKNV